jgi:hypothetical protein
LGNNPKKIYNRCGSPRSDLLPLTFFWAIKGPIASHGIAECVLYPSLPKTRGSILDRTSEAPSPGLAQFFEISRNKKGPARKGEACPWPTRKAQKNQRFMGSARMCLCKPDGGPTRNPPLAKWFSLLLETLRGL